MYLICIFSWCWFQVAISRPLFVAIMGPIGIVKGKLFGCSFWIFGVLDRSGVPIHLNNGGGISAFFSGIVSAQLRGIQLTHTKLWMQKKTCSFCNYICWYLFLPFKGSCEIHQIIPININEFTVMPGSPNLSDSLRTLVYTTFSLAGGGWGFKQKGHPSL